MKIKSTITDKDRAYGVCHAALRYGSLVQFWCESLTGDSTDVSIVSVEFPDEELAENVAAAAAWSGEALPPRRSFGYAVAFDDTVIEFRDPATVEAVLSAKFARTR